MIATAIDTAIAAPTERFSHLSRRVAWLRWLAAAIALVLLLAAPRSAGSDERPLPETRVLSVGGAIDPVTARYLDGWLADRAYYRIALTEPIYRDLLFRSLWLSFSVATLTVVLAYPIAYFISFHGGRHKNLWLFLITIPAWTSYLLRIMSWKVILGYNGVLNSALLGAGIIDEPSTAFLYNTNSVLIALTHAWAVFAILPLYVSLEKVDRTLLEAATDLGDGPLRRFLRVTLPLTIPGIVAALIIVMIPTVGDYVTPRLVGGKDGVMIANAIEVQFKKGANWPLGAALSVTTMIVITMVAGTTVWLIRSAARRIR